MFGKRLNYTRKSKGLTAQQMANELQIALRSYRMYESDNRSPSLEMLVKIADILNVSTDYLLCRDEFIQSSEVASDVLQTSLPTYPKV